MKRCFAEIEKTEKAVKREHTEGSFDYYYALVSAFAKTECCMDAYKAQIPFKDLFPGIIKHYESQIEQHGDDEKALKPLCIKGLFPEIYKIMSLMPVSHKAVVMERGAKISQSLTYMRNYLNKNTDFQVKEHILGVRQIPNGEYYMNAFRYICDCATAEAIFICTANDYMGHFKLREETTYFQLWHGCGIIKKVGLSTIDKSFGKSAKSHREYPINTNYTYVTIASPAQTWIYEEAMNIEKNSGVIVPTGVSRTDVFFDSAYLEKAREKFYKRVPQAKGKKVILYAPTFRGNVGDCVSPDRLDIAALAEALGDEYVFVAKHHPSVRKLPDLPDGLEEVFAFDLTRGQGLTISQLLSVADICISDYSSVAFEFSLFEKPMLFFTYDVDEYIDERGLYYRLEDILPGPMMSTTEEIIDYIVHLDERFDKQRVLDFKEEFMSGCDGHATERIVSLIGTKPSPIR